jgi:lysozyme
VNHFNVGATHSPQLLGQFGGFGAASRTRQPTVTPATAITGAVQGVDVASYQEQAGINWAQVAADGKRFVAIKATEGDYYRNPYALSDLAEAKAAGLAVAAYAFAIPNGDGASARPAVQADDIINYLKSGSAGVLPVMLDIEYDPYYLTDGTNQCYGLSQSAMGSWITGFAAEITRRTGLPPIIYTTRGWWSTCVGTAVSLGSSPLWVASYTNTKSPGTLPHGWRHWTYWQYADTGRVAGIDNGAASTDLDQLNPALLSLLNPGDQQDTAGSPITPVQLRASQGVTYAAAGLPPGLAIDAGTGKITGTAPAAVGTSPVTVTATNPGTGAHRSVTFTWYWHGTLSVTSPASRATVGGSPVGVQAQVSDSPSEPPVMFSGSELPPGLSISDSGKITGWADQPGTYHVTVNGADSLEAAASTTFTWTVSLAPGTGRSGPVRLGLGGMCLDDPHDSSVVGTTADIRACSGSAAQRWTYARDDSLRINGKCLKSPTTAGWKVLLESCTGNPGQQWQLVYPGSVSPSASSGAVTLYNPGYAMCLDDPGSSTSNGTKLVVWPCNGGQNQEWALPRGPIESGIPGKCLTDVPTLTGKASKVVVQACNGTAAQLWTAYLDGTIRTAGKCLESRDGGTTSGSLVDLYRCNRTSAQRWRLISDGGGVMLRNPRSGLCLADPGDSAVNGTRLQILSCTRQDPGRTWRVS